MHQTRAQIINSLSQEDRKIYTKWRRYTLITVGVASLVAGLLINRL